MAQATGSSGIAPFVMTVAFLHGTYWVLQTHAQKTTAVIPLSCSSNPCQNGGICYSFIDDKAIPNRCPDEAAPHLDACYKLERSRKSWFKAQNACARTGGSLFAVDNEQDRIFMENFARAQNITGQPHLWSGGISNYSDKFVWIENGNEVNLSLFDTREVLRGPRHINSTDANVTIAEKSRLASRALCLAIDGASNYSTWIMTSCSLVKLPFICKEKSKSLADLIGKPSHQCQCTLDFEGRECERKLDNGVVSYGTGLKCADDDLALWCPDEPKNLQMDIQYAMYGDILNKQSVCNSDSTGEMANFSIECSIPTAISILRDHCQGKNECTLKMTALNLSDPCPTTPKQTQYRYRCVDKTDVCGTNQFYVQNGCYEVFNKFKATHEEARMFCQLYGGEIPSVHSFEAENIVKEALINEAGKISDESQLGGQNMEIWLDQQYSGMDHFDEPGTNLSLLISEQKIDEKLREKSKDSAKMTFRTKRDDDLTEKCSSLRLTRTDSIQDTTIVWKTVRCRRKLGWICRFPTFSVVPGIPMSGQNLSVHSRSLDQESHHTSPKSGLPRIPPLNITFPSIKPIPEIAPITSIRKIRPITPISAIPPMTTALWKSVSDISEDDEHVLPSTTEATDKVGLKYDGGGNKFSANEQMLCAQNVVGNYTWPRTDPKTMIVHHCKKSEFSDISGRLVKEARKIVKAASEDLLESFDKNVRSAPEGFIFWMCVKTVTGPRYLPLSGPVTLLCEQPSIPEPPPETSGTDSLPISEAQKVAAETALPSFDGASVLAKCGLLENMLLEQQRQSKAAPRMLDFEPLLASTEEFVRVVTHSVSNMLMGLHSPGWSELDAGQRSNAATSLLKAAEDSATMLANVGQQQTDPTPAFEKRLQYENIAMQVMVLPVANITEPVIFSSRDLTSATDNGQWNFARDGDRLELPASIKSFSDAQNSVRLSFVHFSESLSSLLSPVHNSSDDQSNITRQEIVGSRIMAATVQHQNGLYGSVDLGEESVTLIFRNTYSGSSPKCVFWNMQGMSQPFWDSSGCSLITGNDTHTVCKCSHLTNFAVLMDFNGALRSIQGKDRLALNIISYIGCVISIVCLIFCLIIFTFFRQLWCDRVTIHRNLCFCLLIAQFVFVLGVDRVHNQIGCAITAGMLHYTLLAAFAWMLLEGLQLYMMLVQVFESEDSRKVWYYTFGYGIPGIIVTIAASIRPDHYGTEKYCWLVADDGFVWSFAGPVLVIVVINSIFLAVALLTVFRVRNPRQHNNLEKIRGWLRGSVMLQCLLGTTWLFGFLYLNHGSTLVFAYLFTISNSLQGLFIFGFHCLMNEKVFATVQRYIQRCSWCPRWCKACVGVPKSSKSSTEKESSSQHGSMVWNFLRLRRLSHDSLSSQTAIAKKLSSESDYFSKSSTTKSDKINRIRLGAAKDRGLEQGDGDNKINFRAPTRMRSVSENLPDNRSGYPTSRKT